MQTAFKLSFAMSIINGWHYFHRDIGEKLTYGKLVKACNAVSDELSSLVQDPKVCFNCYTLSTNANCTKCIGRVDAKSLSLHL